MTLREIKNRLTEIVSELQQTPHKEKHKIATLLQEREGLITRIKKNFPDEVIGK
jgi:hypothetical protein